LEVLRGFNPNEPQTFTQAYPVGAGVTILSGQVVYALWNGTTLQYEWQLGWVAGAVPYFALNDSTDEDVIETGNLVALSCSGKFELQTAFFKTGDTFNADVPLTPDGVTGNVKATTVGGSAASAPIVGFVTRNHGLKSLVGVNSNVTNTNVISFATSWQPSNGA
jgi:hypothetical protein